MMTRNYGWAIKKRHDGGGAGLLGKHFWLDGMPKPFPHHMNGYVTIVFKTRRQAREALRFYKHMHRHNDWMRKEARKMSVVRVTVLVNEV